MSSAKPSLYPEVILSNPEAISASSTSRASSSSLYPSIDMKDLDRNLIPEEDDTISDSQPHEEILIKIPGVIVHLIETDQSVELASGDLTIVGLKQGDTAVAVLVRVGDDAIQWPLAKDEAAVKLDESHYFFALRVVGNESGSEEMELLNYGVTFASKGQEGLLGEFDKILEKYSSFSVQRVKEAGKYGLVGGDCWVLGSLPMWRKAQKLPYLLLLLADSSKWGNYYPLRIVSYFPNSDVAKEISPEELERDGGKKKKMMDESSAAYWTVLAPNVDDYSSSAARLIAAGSGHVIRGILWCGDVTVDRLKWGEEFLKKRISKGSESEISPGTLRRIKRVKMLTKTSEKVALGILGGVVKVSGFFAGSIVNSKVGQKFCSILPGEIVLASLDGFNKVFDALEVAGKNVMSTSSVVTTGLVSQRYGEQAGKVTNVSLHAAGHAFGTAWAVFKIRKALNPKSAFKPTKLAKAAAQATATHAKQKK